MSSNCAYCKRVMNYKSPFKYPMCINCAWGTIESEMNFPFKYAGGEE